MEYPVYHIDAFTDTLFHRNPACVVPLTEWLPDTLLLQIAQENGLPETAFFVPIDNGFHLRWFTPVIEMDLCGHATLASAHAIKTILDYPSNTITFYTISGTLTVRAEHSGYTMTFPALASRTPPLHRASPQHSTSGSTQS
jgi:phenazine biosynthesis protein PhzF family protein